MGTCSEMKLRFVYVTTLPFFIYADKRKTSRFNFAKELRDGKSLVLNNFDVKRKPEYSFVDKDETPMTSAKLEAIPFWTELTDLKSPKKHKKETLDSVWGNIEASPHTPEDAKKVSRKEKKKQDKIADKSAPHVVDKPEAWTQVTSMDPIVHLKAVLWGNYLDTLEKKKNEDGKDMFGGLVEKHELKKHKDAFDKAFEKLTEKKDPSEIIESLKSKITTPAPTTPEPTTTTTTTTPAPTTTTQAPTTTEQPQELRDALDYIGETLGLSDPDYNYESNNGEKVTGLNDSNPDYNYGDYSNLGDLTSFIEEEIDDHLNKLESLATETREDLATTQEAIEEIEEKIDQVEKNSVEGLSDHNPDYDYSEDYHTNNFSSPKTPKSDNTKSPSGISKTPKSDKTETPSGVSNANVMVLGKENETGSGFDVALLDKPNFMGNEKNPIAMRSAAFADHLYLKEDKLSFQKLNNKILDKIQEKIKDNGVPQEGTLAKRIFDEMYLQVDQSQVLKDEGKLLDPTRGVNNCPGGVCQVPFDLTAIWGFGCWCNFGTNLMMGHSKPVDEVDKLCRDMQLCLRCAKFDAQQVGDVCDPLTQDWVTVSGPNYTYDCASQNAGDKCAERSCCCEADFLAGLMGLVFQLPQYVQDTNFLHSQGFDTDLSCPVGPGPRQEKNCCGVYPDRFPYGIQNRGCCHGMKLYPLATHDCCPDGTTKPIGVLC